MDDYEKKLCNQSADPVSTGIMMSTLWDQSGVISITGNSTITYNEYCPLDGIRHSLTGCTNTAAAQIIYYFIEKYDLDLNLTLTNDDEYTSNISISIKADGSTPGTVSFSQINAKLSEFDINSADDIAALTYACGVVQQANYSASATATAWYEELFLRAGFSCAVISSTYYNYYLRTDPDDDDSPISDAVFEVLIENLTAGRVVGTSYPGHALVIDGYDGSTDKFHINFGWGNSSDTAWYSREEIREKGYHEFVYDLMIDGPTTLTVNDGDLYGTGTMLRAFEQANGISGDNIIEFDDSVKNQTLELLDGITLKENIIIDNFNMSIIVTDDPSGMAFYLSENCTAAFNDFSGDLFVNTAKNNNYAFYAYSGEGITLKTDNASIFSGQYKVNNSLANGCAAVKNAMAAYRSAAQAIETNIINSRRCAVYGSKNSDDILLTNSTIVIGNIILADGDDDISIIGNSHLAGDINAGDGNDTVIIDSSSSVDGFFYSIENIQFELLSLPHTQAMFHIMTNVYNVFNAKYISVDITQAETGSYVLFEADDDASYAEYLSKFSITVTSDNMTQDIVMTAGDNCSYADLICENNQLILNVKIDDTSPDKPTVQADITSITNLNVTVSATFSSDSAVKEYSFDNKNWKTYTTGIKFEQNGIIYFRGMDKAGNYSAVASYEVTNIDRTAPDKPSVTADITQPTNSDVTVSATFSSDSAVREYSFDNKNWKTYTTGIKFEQNGIIYFRGRDKAGNYSDVTSYRVTNIDRNVPDKPTADADVKDITNGDVIVTAAFNDDSVIKEYSLDNKIWNTYTTGVLFKQNGVVYFRAKNASGNISEVTQYAVTNIDKIAPVVEISGNTDSMTDQEVILSVEAEDDASGIKSIRYSFDNSSWNTGRTVTVDSNRTVYFKVTDRAGNVTEKTVVISNIDKKAPDTPTASADITGATNKNVTVTAEFDNDADVKEYSFDRKIWHTYTTGVVMEANGTVYFRGKDKAGNVSEVAKYKVANIDKTAPAKPAAHADITAVTNRHVTVYATFSRDAVTRQYSFDNRNWKEYTSGVVVTTNGNIFFRAEDVVGNVSEITIFKVDNIDKTAPDAPCAIADITGATNKDVTVSAIFSSDTVNGQYSLDNNNWKAYTSGVVMTANGEVFFRAKDAAGNISEITEYEVTNIDKIAPAKPIVSANITAATNQNVTVRATFCSDCAVKEYSLDNKNWKAYTSGVVMTANGSVFFRAKDAAGNVSEVTTYRVSNIDKTPPDTIIPKAGKITVFQISGKQNDLLISMSKFSDNKGIDGYIIKVNGKVVEDDFKGTSYTWHGENLAGKVNVEVIAFDAAGNQSKAAKKKITIKDVTPPEKVTGITVKSATEKATVITWNAAKDNVGVTRYEVVVNGKKYKSKTNSITIKKLKAGTATCTVYALDKAKLKTASETFTFDVADGTNPKAGKITVSQVNGKQNDLLISMSKFSDNKGIDGYIIKVNGKVVEDDFKGTSYTWHGENLAGKKVNVEVIAFDAAGNQSKAAKKKITIKDITPPEKVTGLKVVSANEKEVKLSWNAASDNVGVTQYEVVINGKTYKSKTNSITIKKLKAGTHEFKVYAVDKAKKKSIASDSQNIVIGGTAENTFSRILNAGDNSITLQKSQTAVSPGIEKNKYIDMGSGNDTLSLFDDIELQAELINFGDGNDKFIIGDDGNYLSPGLSAADFGSGDDLFDISKEAVVEFSHDTALHFGGGDDTMILNGVLETGSIDGLENISGDGELIVHGNIDEDLVDKFKTAGIKVTLA